MAKRKHKGMWESDVPVSLITPQTLREAFERTIPGGFAKLFNRVIDSGAFAELTVPAQRIYPVLVRLANYDEDQQFVFDGAIRTIARLCGATQASVVKGLRDLESARLLTCIYRGDRETSTASRFQLLLPRELSAKPARKPTTPSAAKPSPASKKESPPAPKRKAGGADKTKAAPASLSGAVAARASRAGPAPESAPYKEAANNKNSSKTARERLVAIGVEEPNLTRMLNGQDDADVLLKVEAWEWINERAKTADARKGVGYLIASVLMNYSLPEGFRHKLEADQAAELAKDRLARQAATQARAAAEVELRETMIDQVFDETSDEDLEAIAARVREEYRSLPRIHGGGPRTNAHLARLIKAELSRTIA